MKCYFHPDWDATAVCNRCGKSICSQCQVQALGEYYCRNCPVEVSSGQSQAPHSPSLAVVLSFVIPGLGQLYNGETGKALLIFLTSWLFFPWVIGIFDAYRRAKRIKAENIPVRSRPGCIIALAAAVTFFFFVIIIISLLAAIAIPHMLNARVAANEAAARDSISSIEAACDIYIAKNGANPASENDLLPYLPQGLPKANGYDVSIDFPSGGYIIKAAPQACNVSASKVFILRQGSEISSEDCRVRDER